MFVAEMPTAGTISGGSLDHAGDHGQPDIRVPGAGLIIGAFATSHLPPKLPPNSVARGEMA